MAWIESHQDIARHPKTVRLANKLNISIPAAIGHLHLLWWWALDFAKNGDLSRYEAQVIAYVSEWDGDSEFFLESLIDSGFIDREDNVIHIHHWNNGRWSRPQRNDMRRKWDSMARFMRPYILKRDNHTCQECGTRKGPLEIDHIIPIAKGGTNDMENLQVLCLPCNRRKGAN